MKEESLKVGDVVKLYNEITDKWDIFIICCEEDLEMVLKEYKWERDDSRTQLQN
jgi:hypothetical protein